MNKGRIVRLPSAKETERASESNQKAFFPQVGRFFTSKSGKLMITFNHLADVVFLLQEDQMKEDKTEEAPF